MTQPIAEKRKARRAAMETTTRVKLPGGEQVVEIEARTRDISRNGVFLFVDQDVREGTRLEMILMLPDEISDGGRTWISCEGHVVRVEDAGKPGVHGIAATFDKCAFLPEI